MKKCTGLNERMLDDELHVIQMNCGSGKKFKRLIRLSSGVGL